MDTKIIAISGVDGSGKSSVIELIQQNLNENNIENRYIWLRYNHYLTKFLLGFCRFFGLTKYEYFEKSRVVYHNFHRSKIISWLFIFFTFLDTLAVSIILIYIPRLYSEKIIICDRWIFDIMVDLETDTHIDFSKSKWTSKMFKKLIPAECKYFLIDRSYDTVKNIRDESLNDRNFQVRYKLYTRHSEETDIITIDNSGTIENTVEQILEKF